MKLLMLPTDGSPESERAVPYAEAIAQAQDAEILVVHVVDPPVLLSDQFEGGADYQQTFELLEDIAQENLDTLTKRFEAGGLKVHAERPFGPAAAALIDLERSNQPDLVVMATHGRTGVARLALGSVADRLVQHGTVPVLLIREEQAKASLNTALLMLDGSGVAEEAFKGVELLAGNPLHHVKLFQAVADPDNQEPVRTYLEGVAAKLQKMDLQTEISVDLGDPAVLLDRASEGTDFVILSTHGRSGLNRMRHGSVAQQIVRESKKPVLIVRAEILPE